MLNLRGSIDATRFTRLTNAFSKKFENHMHMVALYTVWYNYVKQHKSLKGTRAIMGGGRKASIVGFPLAWHAGDIGVNQPAIIA